MIDQLARLGLEIDSNGVVTATDRLRKLQRQGQMAESTVTRGNKAISQSYGVLRGAVLAAGAALGGIGFARLITEATNYEQAILGVKAVSGATEEQFKTLSDQARSLGATTVFTAQQTAEAQRFLAQAGFEVNEVLSATPGILQLATAASLELGEAADIASNVLSGFRLPVAELSRVNDVLASTAASANTNVSQLAQALSFAAPFAVSAGISIEETSAAIGTLSDAGLQASRAGTGLIGVIRQLSNVTPTAEEALAKYDLTIQDVDITARGLQPVLEDLGAAGISTADNFKIFGSEAGAAAGILANTADRVSELTETLSDSEGSAEGMARVLGSGLQATIRGLGSALSEATLQVGGPGTGLNGGFNSLIQTITGVISVYNGMLPQFVQSNDITEEQTENIEALALALQSLAAGALVLGGLAVATRGAAAAQIAFNVAARANPYALLAAGAVALVTALIKVSNRNKDLVQVFEDAATSSEAYEAAQSRLGDLAQEINSIVEDRITLERRLKDLQENEDNTLGDGGNQAEKDLLEELEQLRVRYHELTNARREADIAAQKRAQAEEEEIAEAEAARLQAQLDEEKRIAEQKEALRQAEIEAERKHIEELFAVNRQANAEEMIARREEREASLQMQTDTLDREIENVIQSLLTRSEIEKQRYSERMMLLEAANEQELEILGGYEAAKEKLEKDHSDRMTEIAREGADGYADAWDKGLQQVQSLQGASFAQLGIAAANAFEGLSDLTKQKLGALGQTFESLKGIAKAGGEESFEAYKALAMVEAGIAGSLAVVKALASAPPPFNFALAGAVGVATAIQIAQIDAQEYQGSYLGGGYTGDGARSGGVDGKGGFPAILHPDETVIDHRKERSQGNQTTNEGNSISVTNVFQISTGVAQTVQAEIERYAPVIEERSRQGVLKAISNGGAMARATGRRA